MAGNSYLIKGYPGSGKTTLGLQFIHAGVVEHREPGLVLTFEERPERLFRDALAFGLDLARLQAEGQLQVVSSSPAAVRQMLLDSTSPLSVSLDRRGVRRIMVDSLTAFRKVYRDEWELRDAVLQLIGALQSREVTPLLIREIHSTAEPAGSELSFEDYLVDAVLQLGYAPSGQRRRARFIEVIKTRSHPHLGGKHSVRIGPMGLEVFPSCQPRAEESEAPPERGSKTATGVDGLDAMLDGGLGTGSSTMLAGSSGTGKTTLALQFLAKGLGRGERVLMLTLQEPPALLWHEAQSIGLRLRPFHASGQMALIYASPIGLDVDELLFRVRRSCLELRPSRVVLDSLSDVVSTIDEESYLRDYIYSLTSLFAELGATSLMTYEVAELFGQFTLTHHRISGLIDNVIFLRYVEMDSELKRAVSVLKVRGSNHDKRIHELTIGAEGVQVATVFEDREGLMSGAPKRIVRPAGDVDMGSILENLAGYQEARQRFQSMRKGQGALGAAGPEPGHGRPRPRP